MSIDVSQVPELVAKTAYPVMFQAYEAEPAVYPLITDVRPADPGMLGTKGSVISGVGDLVEILDGERLPHDTVKGTRTWYCKVRSFGGKIEIPLRQLAAIDAVGKIQAQLAEVAPQWGRRAIAQKEQMVADVFQKGTIAAGNTSVFNGSYVGETDANVGFIFDGKPFFAATGNGHPLLAGSSTPFNLVASAPLTSANMQTTLTAMRTTNAIDDRELKIRVTPTHLVVPPGLEFTARTLLNSVNLPGTAQNDVNVVAGALQPVVWRYLTDDADAWWVGAVGQGGGVRVYDSGAPTIDTWVDMDRRMFCISAVTFFGVVVTDWRQWFCNNKATS